MLMSYYLNPIRAVLCLMNISSHKGRKERHKAWDTQILRKVSLLIPRTSYMKVNLHLIQRRTTVRNPSNQYAAIVRRQVILIICRRRSSSFDGYRSNAYEGYKPSTFNGYCYTCNKYGHRVIECRPGMNNQRSFMNQRPKDVWQRSFNDRRNPTWQRPYVNWFSPSEMEKRMNMICTICNNYGHVAMNYRRRTSRGYARPQRASGMACYHRHKSGHIVRFYGARMKQSVNQFADQKRKNKVDVEETRVEMNKIWRKKSDEKFEDKSLEDSHSSPNVENRSPIN